MSDDRPENDGRPSGESHDRKKASGLPPGSSTKGDPGELRGNDREQQPYEEAPAEGRLAPDADNPAP